MDLEYELMIPEFVLAGLASAIVALGLLFPRLRQEVLGYTAAAATLVLLVLTAVFYINVNDDFANIIAVDNYTVLFRVFFLGIAFFTIVASMQYAGERLKNHAEYYGLILFATLGMILMASARELITAYIALELLSFSLYILVGFNKLNPFSNEASLKYMLLGAFSSALFLYGLSMIYGVTGTTTYGPIEPDGVEAGRNIATQLGNFGAGAMDSALPTPSDIRPGLLVGLVLVVAGIGFKVSAVPFHQWTPDAYQGAPLPITAFLSAGGKAAAFALFLRLFAEGLLPASSEWVWLVALIAALTMIVGNLMALQQTNMKRLLAYSSISQVGYLLIGIVALHADSLSASHNAASALVLHLIGYVATNIAVFAVLIAFYNRTGRDDISDLRGLASRQPFLALMMTIGLFSLSGMPLFAGFVTKFILFQSAVDSGFLWLAGDGHHGLVRVAVLLPDGDQADVPARARARGGRPVLGAAADADRHQRAHCGGVPGGALPGAAVQGDRERHGAAVPGVLEPAARSHGGQAHTLTLPLFAQPSVFDSRPIARPEARGEGHADKVGEHPAGLLQRLGGTRPAEDLLRAVAKFEKERGPHDAVRFASLRPDQDLMHVLEVKPLFPNRNKQGHPTVKHDRFLEAVRHHADAATTDEAQRALKVPLKHQRFPCCPSSWVDLAD